MSASFQVQLNQIFFYQLAVLVCFQRENITVQIQLLSSSAVDINNINSYLGMTFPSELHSDFKERVVDSFSFLNQHF